MKKKKPLSEKEIEKLKEEYPALTDDELDRVCAGGAIDYGMVRKMLEIIFKPLDEDK